MLQNNQTKRWPVTCPHCGSKEVQKNGHIPKGAQKYHCKNCGKYFLIRKMDKEKATKVKVSI